MCGLTGIIDPTLGTSADGLTRLVRRMADTLVHRGRDDAGTWVDAAAGIALGHRRLSIIDLSPMGHQPMISCDGRYVIAYNGEVYNFQDLRCELEADGVAFRGASDTEVIVEACAHWGPAAAITRLNGMFAFALWDRTARRLILARDHMGIKPLYWGLNNGVFLFGSELKALRAHPGHQPGVNRQALAAYLRHLYIPAPMSIYEGIYKLQPGRMLMWQPGEVPKISCYWDLRQAAVSGHNDPYAGSPADALDGLEALLKDSIKGQMIADVPLGAFLSGGIDSSTVVALMQAQSSQPVRTFSIGFTEDAYDEAPHARAIAAHLGTDHTEFYAGAGDALLLIPKLHNYYDEPFADSSQLSTCLVSHMAREEVTVALSGDGGDELFAGYHHYRICAALWQRLSKAPLLTRQVAAALLGRMPGGLAAAMSAVLPGAMGQQLGLGRLQRIVQVLGATGADDLYRRVISQWPDPGLLMPGITEAKGAIWDSSLLAAVPGFTQRMQYYDAAQYLPDDVLTKVDRASMAVSLETRLPLLDHRVLAFAWRLPMTMKLGEDGGKVILRQLLARYVPRELFERPKKGFAVPMAGWLRGGLRDWAEDLLSESRLRADGFFNPAPIRAAWQAHLTDQADLSHMVWTILMFQQWLHGGSSEVEKPE